MNGPQPGIEPSTSGPLQRPGALRPRATRGSVNRGAIISTLLAIFQLLPAAFASDETCASCAKEVSVSGDFVHRKENLPIVIEGATTNAEAFCEEISGKNFIVTIAGLPAGKYTLNIGEAETWARLPGERVFDVTCGALKLATNFDIFTAAGGWRKVCWLSAVVTHEDDALRGPLAIAFVATNGTAKFNTIEVKDGSGASVTAFSASDLAGPFSAPAARLPDISDAPLWREPSGARTFLSAPSPIRATAPSNSTPLIPPQPAADKNVRAPATPLKARVEDLMRRMSLAEKLAQLQNEAPAIERLGLPAYNYWSEALHGVANNGTATVFPQAIGMAATWNTALIHQESAAIGIEGRAKFNDYASKPL